MKKEKQESPEKAAKKIAKKSIQLRLVKTLKNITTELGQEEINIEKEAKKLAKKITKNLKPVKEADKNNEPASGAKKAEKAPAADKAKVAKAAPIPAAKPIAKAVPAKTLTPKKEAPKAVAPKSPKK